MSRRPGEGSISPSQFTAQLQLRIVLTVLIPLSATVAAEEPPQFAEAERAFLQQYCLECHSGADASAELSLDVFQNAQTVVQQRLAAEKVIRVLTSREMPPQDAQQPDAAAAETVLRKLQQVLDFHDRHAEPDPGRVTMRRLNRLEYRNTIRDLVGVTFDPAENFPSDDIGHGFDNIGDVLTLSPILMERYLEAAETVMDKAITPIPAEVVKRRLASQYTEPASGEVQKQFMDGGFRRLASDGADGVATGPLHTPYKWEEGEYRFRVRVYAGAEGDQPVRAAILVQGGELNQVSSEEELLQLCGSVRTPALILKQFEVTARDPESAQVVEITVPQMVGRDRMMIGQFRPQEGGAATTLWVEYLALDGPLDTRPASQRLLLDVPDDVTESDRTVYVLTRFLRRAWRRPVSAAEVERLGQLVQQVTAAGKPWEAGMQLAMQAVLCSADFLFRVERDEAPAATQARALSEHQLATRLSYFLWASMPDDELLELADQGQLMAQLPAQVGRMLADKRSSALVTSFAMQWLQLQRLDLAEPDREMFPMFNDDLRRSMRRETELFIESIIQDDRSLLDLISADYTFLNEPLASLYGIRDTAGSREGDAAGGTPIRGPEFVRVALPGGNRGGLLTQASILTVTSNPTRTSPVKRGRWVLEQILGAPPPPPPPNVPELPESEGSVATGSLRQRLEQHRENAACANCHARMDPLGFALENFDAVGRYRTKDGEFEIDPSGELPDGTTVGGPTELKQVILSRRREFLRCVVEKLLVYSLGRGLEYYDRPVTEAIIRKAEETNFRFSSVMTAIVQSEAFGMRRGLQSESEQK